MLEGKKVLITGLTGQVGEAIAKAHAPRCELWGFARFSKPGSRELAESMGVKTVVGDLGSGRLDGLPDDFDYVLHFAANTRPGTSDNGMLQNAEASGLLLHHCRKAKAFLHVGATGCYMDHPDPYHVFLESDHLGGQTPFALNYGPTKVAGEGVVRTLARIHNVPVTIARLDVSYGGPQDDGGLPGSQLKALVEGQPIRLPTRPCLHSPIHEDDLADHIEPLLKAASVPATIVNWGGDEGVNAVDWVNHLGALTGLTPQFHFSDEMSLPNCITDTAKGREIGLTWKVHWKEGMRRMVEARYPDIPIRAAS